MKLTRIFACRVDLPLHEGSCQWSGGKSVSVFDSTIVGVETDYGAAVDRMSARAGKTPIPDTGISIHI